MYAYTFVLFGSEYTTNRRQTRKDLSNIVLINNGDYILSKWFKPHLEKAMVFLTVKQYYHT